MRCAKEGACVYVDHVTAIPSVPQIPPNAIVARSVNVMITHVITSRISSVEVGSWCFLMLHSTVKCSRSTCELVNVN